MKVIIGLSIAAAAIFLGFAGYRTKEIFEAWGEEIRDQEERLEAYARHESLGGKVGSQPPGIDDDTPGRKQSR